MGRMAEMRATGIFVLGLAAPLLVPVLRSLLPFIIYVVALGYFVHKHKAGTSYHITHHSRCIDPFVLVYIG